MCCVSCLIIQKGKVIRISSKALFEHGGFMFNKCISWQEWSNNTYGIKHIFSNAVKCHIGILSCCVEDIGGPKTLTFFHQFGVGDLFCWQFANMMDEMCNSNVVKRLVAGTSLHSKRKSGQRWKRIWCHHCHIVNFRNLYSIISTRICFLCCLCSVQAIMHQYCSPVVIG